MNNSPVKAKCRVCGNMAPADQFRLHYEKRLMVCPSCFKGKPQPEGKSEPLRNEVRHKEEKAAGKPLGWDEVDEYLAKMQKRSPAAVDSGLANFTRISGSELLKCRCGQCKYEFKFDPLRRVPATCPYCNGEIPKVRTIGVI